MGGFRPKVGPHKPTPMTSVGVQTMRKPSLAGPFSWKKYPDLSKTVASSQRWLKTMFFGPPLPKRVMARAKSGQGSVFTMFDQQSKKIDFFETARKQCIEHRFMVWMPKYEFRRTHIGPR